LRKKNVSTALRNRLVLQLRHDVTGAYQALAPNRPWNRFGVKGALVRRSLAAGLQRRSAPHLRMTDVQQHVTPLFVFCWSLVSRPFTR